MKPNTILLILIGLLSMSTSCKKNTTGCTDPTSSNFDPDATIDNGTCNIKGCTNPNSDNYNPEAKDDDGSCNIAGCTDTLAANYNPDATIDDGSCEIHGCTKITSDNYNPEATEDDGSCIAWSDKLVGLYDANLTCTLLIFLNNDFEMEVTRIGDEVVTMKMELGDNAAIPSIPLSAQIDKNNNLTLNKFELEGLDLKVPVGQLEITIKGIKIQGGFIYDPLDESINGNMLFTFKTNLGEQSDTCPLTAIKKQ